MVKREGCVFCREDILIFLTGQEEIESAVKSIRSIEKNITGKVPALIVCPLYAALPAQQQLKVFQSTPKVCNCVNFVTLYLACDLAVVASLCEWSVSIVITEHYFAFSIS